MASFFALSGVAKGGRLLERVLSLGPMSATWGGAAGRRLLDGGNIGVLTQQEFILVVISSVIGFLLIVALVIMVVLITR